jgi:hypothetical protein
MMVELGRSRVIGTRSALSLAQHGSIIEHGGFPRA